MSRRLWLYTIAASIILLLIAFRAGSVHSVNKKADKAIASQNASQSSALDSYLSKQTDAFKLVALAKLQPTADSAYLQKVIDRAYQLNSTSPQIAYLASFYHPELKSRVKELDPLKKLD